jgi:hypothetical protein
MNRDYYGYCKMKIRSDNEKLNAVLSAFYTTFSEVKACCENDREYTTNDGNGVNSSECYTVLDALRKDIIKAIK